MPPPPPFAPQSPICRSPVGSCSLHPWFPPASPGRIHEILPDGIGPTIAKRTRSAISLEDHSINDLEQFLDEVMQADDGAEEDFDEYEKFLQSLSNGMPKHLKTPSSPSLSRNTSQNSSSRSTGSHNYPERHAAATPAQENDSYAELQYMDSDEDDIDFDPHLDPSALHALEEDSPSKTKIEVQKEEWKTLLKMHMSLSILRSHKHPSKPKLVFSLMRVLRNSTCSYSR